MTATADAPLDQSASPLPVDILAEGHIEGGSAQAGPTHAPPALAESTQGDATAGVEDDEPAKPKTSAAPKSSESTGSGRASVAGGLHARACWSAPQTAVVCMEKAEWRGEAEGETAAGMEMRMESMRLCSANMGTRRGHAI